MDKQLYGNIAKLTKTSDLDTTEWPWPFQTDLGYSGTVPLYWGTSAINLE